jgi:hypothetical protein
VTPMILGGLHGIRAIGTTSFEVLVSPPLPGSVDQAVGCCSHLSKTPSRTGVQVEALLTDHQLLHSPHEGCGVGPGH